MMFAVCSLNLSEIVAPITAVNAPNPPTIAAARMSTLAFLRLRNVPMIAVGTMTATDVPLATTVAMPSVAIAGTMITPPPMPSSPASVPDTNPTRTRMIGDPDRDVDPG